MDYKNEIPVILQDLPTSVRGFASLGEDFSPIIVINARLPVEQQRKTYKHELKHILSGEIYNPDFHEYGGAI